MVIVIQPFQRCAVTRDHCQYRLPVQIILRPLHQPDHLTRLFDTSFIDGIPLQDSIIKHAVSLIAEFHAAVRAGRKGPTLAG